MIKLRKKIWGERRHTSNLLKKDEKHNGAHPNVKGKDLRPVPKIRRTKEDINALEVGGEDAVNNNDDSESSDDSRITVSLDRASINESNDIVASDESSRGCHDGPYNGEESCYDERYIGGCNLGPHEEEDAPMEDERYEEEEAPMEHEEF